MFCQYAHALFSQWEECDHYCNSREDFLHPPRRYPSLTVQKSIIIVAQYGMYARQALEKP